MPAVRRLRIHIAALLLLMGWSLPARAGWHTFRRDLGLAGDDVYGVMQTRGGEFWFSGDEGAAYSDGVQWTRVLLGTPVNGVLEDTQGGLWFATYGQGVCRRTGAVWDTLTVANTRSGLAEDYVTQVLQTHDGAFWFGTYGGGASYFDGVAWRTLAVPQLTGNFVEAILEDRAREVWFATSGGVTRLGAGGQLTRFTPGNSSLPADSVHALAEDAAGGIWAGLSRGIVVWRDGAWTIVRQGVDVRGISEGVDGAMWFATRQGVYRFDGHEWLRFGSQAGVASDVALNVSSDRNGNMWIGTNRGVSRFDGQRASLYIAASHGPDQVAPQDTILAADSVTAVAIDSSARIWIGTTAGVSRLDVQGWRNFTDADSLPGRTVHALAARRDGSVWIATTRGVTRCDHSGWRYFTASDGFPAEDTQALALAPDGTVLAGSASGVREFRQGAWHALALNLSDPDVRVLGLGPDGALWIGGPRSLFRCDGGDCVRYSTSSGLPRGGVQALLVDGADSLWVGTPTGLGRYASGAWTVFDVGTGMAANDVRALVRDRKGVLWVGTAGAGGVGRFDGAVWRNFGQESGLGSGNVLAISIDRHDNLWLGTTFGATRLEPDRAAPVLAILSRPRAVTPARTQRIAYVAGFDEDPGFQGANSVDAGATWSPWSAISSWSADLLQDGAHTVWIRGQDAWNNLGDPLAVSFVVDATPPAPVLSAPPFGAAVRGLVAVTGTTADSRLQHWRLETGIAARDAWHLIHESPAPVVGGTLGTWDTHELQDGLYDIKLTVLDSLGLLGVTTVTVQVDNNAPFADETSPVAVRRTAGAHVYSGGGEVHAYFPAYTFDQDAVVTIELLDPASVDSPGGKVLLAAQLQWGGAALRHAANLEVQADASVPGILWKRTSDGNWERLGGTRNGAHVAVPIQASGLFALVAGGAPPQAEAALSAIETSPRVLSGTGAFAAGSVAVQFRLGRAGPVWIRLYNAAGRLVRNLASGTLLQPGVNSVAWDGRDDDGRRAAPGPYVVHVRANGSEQTATVVVTR